jgi:cytochrome c oxidase assembly protein subunit 15
MLSPPIPDVLTVVSNHIRMNHSITIDQFKSIFYMEWTHRVLGRIIGIAFVAPLTYFFLRRKLTPSLPSRLSSLALLIGAQGFLGWYMVKSGLEDSLMDVPGTVPRVSQYRLAAHLGTAFVLFAGMLGTGLAAIKDWRFAHGENWTGRYAIKNLNHSRVKRFTRLSRAVTALVFLTALSGTSLADPRPGVLTVDRNGSQRRVCRGAGCRAGV